MSKGIGVGGALGALPKAMCGVNEPVVLMDKQVVFHPQDSGADSMKAKVSIEKNYNGAALKAGISFGGNRSLLGEMLREFAGEFMIKVEKEEEINDARITLDEFHKFVREFVLVTEKALDMYPEMAKKEEKTEETGFGKLKAMIGSSCLSMGNPVATIMDKINEVEQETGMKAVKVHITRELANLIPADPRFPIDTFNKMYESNKFFEFDVEWNAEELVVDVGDEPIVKTKVSEEE